MSINLNLSVFNDLQKLSWKVQQREPSSNLDKPRQEENQSYKVEVGAPARETVNGSVHEEHPAFLRRSFIHSEDTRAWAKTHKSQKEAVRWEADFWRNKRQHLSFASHVDVCEPHTNYYVSPED